MNHKILARITMSFFLGSLGLGSLYLSGCFISSSCIQTARGEMVASMYAKSVRQKLPNTQLQALLDDVVKTQHIPGVAMYISTPQGKWRGASGVTSRETNQPLQPDDDFSIASTSKTFVAVVVLQLVHEGRIKLDQTIASYLPQSVGDRVKFSHQITVRQLLNHTSDVAEYLSTPAFIDATQHRDRTRPWTAAEAIQYMFNEPPKASPGTEFSYTDTNYILLELIVQQVTQGTLAQAIRDRILDPLRLKHTYTELREPALGNLVTGYGLNSKSGKMQSFAQINDGNGLGDGSLVSNGEDLSKFIQVLVSGNKLLPEKIKQEMFTFVNDGYGLGLECWTTPFGMAYGHSGSAYGMVSIMLDLPEKHTSVVVLANQQGVDPKDIAIKALASIFPQGS